MIESVLNSRQAKALFEDECVLIGDRDVFPIERVAWFFGKECAEWVKYSNTLVKPGVHQNSWHIDDCHVDYLTYVGFQIAVTWHNITVMCREA